MNSARAGKLALSIAFQYAYLLGLWMLFVSSPKKNELYAGLAAAFVATVAHAVVRRRRFVEFRPRWTELWLIAWEPWYAVTGTYAILRALGRKLLGKPSEAEFRTVCVAGAHGKNAVAQAHRALLIAYMTMPPNFIVVGIDQERGRMLVHQVSPTPTPLIAKKMGALE